MINAVQPPSSRSDDLEETSEADESGPSLSDAVARITEAERKRLQATYTSLEHLIATGPIRVMLSNVSVYGGHVQGRRVDHLAPPVRMATCLTNLYSLSMMGLESWFDRHWGSAGTRTLEALRAIGNEPFASRIEQLSRLPEQLGVPITADHNWSDLKYDHDEHWPSREELGALAGELPAMYRAYWQQRDLSTAV